jgi:hypothetical protein
VLLAPSASALRIMLAICDNHANEYCISFNASKSKCLVVLPDYRRILRDYLKIAPVMSAIILVNMLIHLHILVIS